MVRWCIEQLRISVDSQDQFNQTALHWAASFNKSKAPPALTACSRIIHILDSFGFAPAFASFTFLIHLGLFHLPHPPSATMIATMLIENYGCDLNPADLNGDSLAMFSFLFTNFILPFIQSFSHSSIRHIAFTRGEKSVRSFILRSQA
jgi:hypothetical protein